MLHSPGRSRDSAPPILAVLERARVGAGQRADAGDVDRNEPDVGHRAQGDDRKHVYAADTYEKRCECVVLGNSGSPSPITLLVQSNSLSRPSSATPSSPGIDCSGSARATCRTTSRPISAVERRHCSVRVTHLKT